MTTIDGLGHIVRNARWEAGLTQDLMASRAGVSRAMLARIESGSRNPSLPMLERLLAVAGKQVRIELEPLDADVRRAIAEHRAADAPPATVTALHQLAGYSDWPALLPAVPHRFEGLAAASLLGAPVPVESIEVALADVPATWRWLTERLTELAVRVTPTGCRNPMGIGGVPHRSELARLPDDVAAARVERAMHLLREQVLGECSDRRLTVTGPFDDPRASVRLVDADQIKNAVPVETEVGTLRAQPRDEIQAADGRTARVLAVLREELPV